METKVGFVGLGVMGKPMARNLLKAGYRVTVKSRRPDPEIELAAEGAIRALTPAEVARASDIVITMLPNSPEVLDVCFGENGIAFAATPDSPTRVQPLTVVDMSTISPKVSREIGARFRSLGVDWLEAPVSGGDVGAIAGTLAIMAGGPERVFERVLPLFRVLGKSAVRIGDWGAGQTTKLANNVIAATTIEAVAEGLVLAAKSGVDPEKMYEAIKGGAAACWSLDHKVPKIVARDFAPGFMCKLHLKDLNLALDAAKEVGMELPVTRMVRDMLKELVDEGRGDEDNGALVKVVERLAGGYEVRRVSR